MLLLVLWLVTAFPISSHLSPASALDGRANEAIRVGLFGRSNPLGLQSDLCDFASAAATAEALNLAAGGEESTAYADDFGSLMCLFKREGGQERTPGRLLRVVDGLFDVAVVSPLSDLLAPVAERDALWALTPRYSQTTPGPILPPPREPFKRL